MARYRDLPYTGSFHCSDPRLDSIWETAAYTVHLNMQEYLWDGIKRDRCIWLGDMHPEVKTIMAVFDDREVVEKSLDKAVEQYPLPSWLNGMSSYSLWYLIIHHDWFMRHGNLDFLNRHKDYITGLVNQLASRIDENGNEEMNPGRTGNMTRFLDWPSTPNRQGVEAGYRALMSWALSSAEEASSMILSRKAHGLTTFYGYYMLEALALTGNYREGLDMIRSYWGAMLDLGATSFWEDFNMEWLKNAARIDEMTPEGKIDIHGTYGDYCYNGFRHSLCHGWSSGPCPWLSQHILGINIEQPGCRKVSITPHLCDLDFAEGTFPTPYGSIYISHIKDSEGKIISDIKLPDGVELVNPSTTNR